MLEDMRKYVRAGLEALSSQGPDDPAGAIMSRASGLAEQLSAFASGFLEWSAEARASLLQEVKDMITRQVETMGLATMEEVDALRRRIDRLEGTDGRAGGGLGSGPKARKSLSRKATSKSKRGATSKSKRGAMGKAASRSTASRRGAKRSTASRSTASRSTTRSRGPRRSSSE